MASQNETAGRDLQYSNPTLGNSNNHRILTDAELAIFRTQLCEAQCRGSCPDPDRCSHSHCLTWQRRNPLRVFYSPTLCPDIEFIRRNSRMALVRRCTRGRSCPYAHSKEEELYHPMVYKTKMCKVFPHCKRHHCPFAHTASELRRRMTAEEYHTAKFAATDSSTKWTTDGQNLHTRSKSPCSGMTSTLTTEASANTGPDNHFLLKSPNSAQITASTSTMFSCGQAATSPRSLPNMCNTFPGFAERPIGLSAWNCAHSANLQDPRELHCSFPRSADPFEVQHVSTAPFQNYPAQDDLIRGLEAIIDKLAKLQIQRRAEPVMNQEALQVVEHTDATIHESHLAIDETKSNNQLHSIPLGDDHYDTLWKEIATALVCGSSASSSANPHKREVQHDDSEKATKNQNSILPHLIAASGASQDPPMPISASLLTSSPQL